MDSIKQINHNRRSFFKNAGLLSLSISLPMLRVKVSNLLILFIYSYKLIHFYHR
jgi:hypothetical protein